MKVMFPSQALFTFAGILVLSPLAAAQTTTTTQLFGPINDRSLGVGTYDAPVVFGELSVSLTCAATDTARLMGLASDANPDAKLLVDNNILVTVSQGSYTNLQKNVCPADGVTVTGYGLYNNNCFAFSWESAAWNSVGQNPDTLSADYGVKPFDISGTLKNDNFDPSKPITMDIALADEGYTLASSSIFLQTTCKVNGVGAGTVQGNPINGSDNQGTAQAFTFNSDTDNLRGIKFGYDVTGALNAGTVGDHKDGAIPRVSDAPVDPSSFQADFVPGTSFATSNCLIHSGEVFTDANNVTKPACKLYTLQCLSPDTGTWKGAYCPVSSQLNEVLNDLFDGPQFQLYDIHNKSGGVIHEGIGFLMASDTWPGTGTDPTLTNCQFEVESGLSAAPCPLNLLTSFTGPGAFSGNGQTTNPNSEFISVYGVPLDKTIVTVTGEKSGNWVNTGTPTIKFDVQAPNLTSSTNGYPYIVVNGIKTSVPGASSYIPQPIKNVSYGITTAAAVPNPVNEPIAGDVTLGNASPTYVGCAQGPLSSQTQPDLITSDTVSSGSALSDGQYLLHYYAQDCAGTQELNFTMAPGTGVWSTSFFTRPLNVDTTKPQVNVISPTGTPSYAKNSTAYVSYSCTDAGYVQGGPNTGSGVVKCGSYNFGVGSTFNTNVLTTKLNTSTTGSKSYVIYAIDGAGNQTSATVYYNVN